jgi:hypothetical protein
MNRIVKKAGLPFKSLGDEVNFFRLRDDNIDHSRSYTSCKAVKFDWKNAQGRFSLSLKEAQERVADWSR